MDNLSPEQRRKNMQNIRSVGTKPEELIAKELRKRRIYYARNVKTILGKPDFVFRRKKIAVFVDSDFWHGHKTRCIMPKTNCESWNKKIDRNKKRDREVSRKLKQEGWKVIRIWEKDINENVDRGLKKIVNFL